MVRSREAKVYKAPKLKARVTLGHRSRPKTSSLESSSCYKFHIKSSNCKKRPRTMIWKDLLPCLGSLCKLLVIPLMRVKSSYFSRRQLPMTKSIEKNQQSSQDKLIKALAMCLYWQKVLLQEPQVQWPPLIAPHRRATLAPKLSLQGSWIFRLSKIWQSSTAQ